MAAPTIAPYRSAAPAGNDGFGQLLWAEWTKFRTVRGWVIGLIVAGLLTVGIGLLSHIDYSPPLRTGIPAVTGRGSCFTAGCTREVPECLTPAPQAVTA